MILRWLIILLALVLTSFKVNAQIKADSAYYLLDTAKTLPSDRLWHTYKEGLVKFYELRIYAPCSELMNKPTFAYSSHSQQPVTLTNSQLNSIKTSSLSELIYKLKQFANEDRTVAYNARKSFYLYLIEPRGGGYTIVKTTLDGSGPRSRVN